MADKKTDSQSDPEADNSQNQDIDQTKSTPETDEQGVEYPVNAEPEADDDILDENADEAELISTKGRNTFLRKLMDYNYIEYASYVIRERAIPDVDDGLKPVQRRILWALYKIDDGKFHKVANVIGDTMKYHPHGDASIGQALVVLANTEYYIEKQGNFGNILTGDKASAARYIECRLTTLAKEVMFNNDITEFIDSYDGRNKEPVRFPAKVPSTLMLGTRGIALGMSTNILSHNFKELLEAQIAYLQNEEFRLYPDFLQGGLMDVSEYNDGEGKVVVRARIEQDGRKLIIREIPATTTTESILTSIERAVNRNKIKVAAINDYTGENVEIEIIPMRGYDPARALHALYAYTDCEISISSNLMVICDGKPVQMTVTEILKRNTDKLVSYLKRELEILLGKLEDRFHEKTLEQIFIENRIYKRIEECETDELVMSEIYQGLEKFKHMLKRDIVDEDIHKLLALPIRRISRFDINKNRKDLEDILKQIDEVRKNLKRIKAYTIKYIKALLEKYGDNYPRRTEIVDSLEKVNIHEVALNNIKVGWDRKNCYVGTHVRSEEIVTCNEFDHLLCLERNGQYKIINIPDKAFVGRLFYFARYDKKTEFAIVYRDKKSGKCYYKRCRISKFITDRKYELCPKNCKLEIITTRINSLYKLTLKTRVKSGQTMDLDLRDAPERSARARGLLITSKQVVSFRFQGLLEEVAPTPDNSGEEVPEEVTEKSANSANITEDQTKTSNPDVQPEQTTKDESDEPVSSKTVNKPIKAEEKTVKKPKKSSPPVTEKSETAELPVEKKKQTDSVKQTKAKKTATTTAEPPVDPGNSVNKENKASEVETATKASRSETTKEKAVKKKKLTRKTDEKPKKEDSVTIPDSETDPAHIEKMDPRKDKHNDNDNNDNDDDNDNDLGITQPEFSF